jgi:DNA segregation ATPase FtsK/SpoIIIE, S-DNA-T family
VNHARDDDNERERELFARLEADWTDPPDGPIGDVVDLDAARSARAGDPIGSADPGAPGSGAGSADGSGDGSADGSGRPVDRPDLPPTGVRVEKRRPILPEWVTNRRSFIATARHTAERWWYATRYHGVRVVSGRYAVGLARHAPRGAYRFLSASNRWLWDREAAPLRSLAVQRGDAATYMQLTRRRDARVRLRVLLAFVALLVGVIGAAVLYVLAPGWLWVIGTAGVLALGWAGQEEDRPVIGPAVRTTEVPKLTSSIVLRALGAIGNSRINAALKKGGDMDGMHFVSEICRDGPGYRAELDLPYGVTPDDITDRRESLASGLRRKVGCVWPSGDPSEHEGRMVLWVGDKPMNETKKPAWPLAKAGQVDLFKPVVFANDQRMRWVELTLMFASVVVGSIPRMGKTFLLRLLLLICALDPRSVLYMFDFKGTGDFRALEPVAHRYRAGDEDDDVEYCLRSLREIKEEMRRRSKVIRSLPHAVCPESKVTSALASDKRYGLHPIAVCLDECQVAFEHDKYGAEIESICTDITKRGPALGIIGMFGTQRPDAKSLPPGISSNAVLRFALKVMGQVENDMILGTSMYKAGHRATMFSREDRGIALMAGEGDDPRIVCGAFVDAPAAALISSRARVLREEYGNITGHALGEGPARGEGLDILADVLKVFPPGEDKAWFERLAEGLAALRPDVYDAWGGEQVSAALKPYGITSVQVGRRIDGKVVNRRGVARADILKSITERDDKRAA